MARKQTRTTKRMLFTWLLLTGFIILLAPEKLTNRFQFAFARIFQWPLSMGRNVTLSARARYSIETNVVNRREYNQLQNHLANVIEQRDEAQKKLEKTAGLRIRYPLEGAKLVPVDVSTAFMSGSQCELIINRGGDDGLAEGQFVLGDNGIIGTICRVDRRSSQVKLITDPESKIAVKIEQSDAGMVMQGKGNNSAKIRLVSTKHKVKIGDIVRAVQKPGFLDSAMIVGKVSRCQKDDENPLLWDITVDPVFDLESLNIAAVIIMNPQE